MFYIRLLTMTAILLGAFSEVDARVYEYRSPDGTIRYTDDPSGIPIQERDDVRVIPTIPTSAASDVPVTDTPTSSSEQTAGADTNLIEEAEALEQEQAYLEKEYENIREAKKNLENTPGPDASASDLREHEQKIQSINARIKDYTKRMESYEERVEAFNAQFGH